MTSDTNKEVFVIKEEWLPWLQGLIKENNIKNLEDLFKGALALLDRYQQAVRNGRRVVEVDEKTGDVIEIILDWRMLHKPTLTLLKGKGSK